MYSKTFNFMHFWNFCKIDSWSKDNYNLKLRVLLGLHFHNNSPPSRWKISLSLSLSVSHPLSLEFCQANNKQTRKQTFKNSVSHHHV